MARVRAKSHERFSDPAILKQVIRKLEQSTPITKKEACEILNISYNTARLNKIIQDYKDKIELDRRLRNELRGTPVSSTEKRVIITAYLEAEALTSISEYTHRSIQTIKNVLRTYNIPLRTQNSSYFRPIYLEGHKASNDYTKGDLVYSARYSCPAYIRGKVTDEAYTLWTTGAFSKSVTQPFYELADLRRIQTELGIEIQDMSKDEYNSILREALINANKRKNKNDR